MTKAVIFRKFPNQSVIALFPTEPAGEGSVETACSAFNKHGRVYVDISVVKSTAQASDSDIVPLLLEMAKAGYDLAEFKIVKRVTAELNQQRLSVIKAQQKATKKAA